MNTEQYEYEIPLSKKTYLKWKDHFPINSSGHNCENCKKSLQNKAFVYNRLNRGYYCQPCGKIKMEKERQEK